MCAILMSMENEEKETSMNQEILYFSAKWCGPCKVMGPNVEKLKENYNLNIKKIDIDENREMAQEYGVMSIPTLIRFQDGNETGRRVGNQRYSELKKWLVSE